VAALAEIEAVYICFTGLALVIWASPLVTAELPGYGFGIWPAILLALGLLTKGADPTSFFFYGVISARTDLSQRSAYAGPARPRRGPLADARDLQFMGHPLFVRSGQHGPLGVWQFWMHQITSPSL